MGEWVNERMGEWELNCSRKNIIHHSVEGEHDFCGTPNAHRALEIPFSNGFVLQEAMQ